MRGQDCIYWSYDSRYLDKLPRSEEFSDIDYKQYVFYQFIKDVSAIVGCNYYLKIQIGLIRLNWIFEKMSTCVILRLYCNKWNKKIINLNKLIGSNFWKFYFFLCTCMPKPRSHTVYRQRKWSLPSQVSKIMTFGCKAFY